MEGNRYRRRTLRSDPGRSRAYIGEIKERLYGYGTPLDKILRKARMSPELKEEVRKIGSALSRERWSDVYRLSAVKSKIARSGLSDKETYWEDRKFNEKGLGGDTVYGILDSLHHDAALLVGRIPSGMTVLAPGSELGTVTKAEYPSRSGSLEGDTTIGILNDVRSNPRKDRVRKVYSSIEELEAYDRMYGIVRRLGYRSAREFWDDNPVIGGFVYPEELRVMRPGERLPRRGERLPPARTNPRRRFANRIAVGDTVKLLVGEWVTQIFGPRGESPKTITLMGRPEGSVTYSNRQTGEFHALWRNVSTMEHGEVDAVETVEMGDAGTLGSMEISGRDRGARRNPDVYRVNNLTLRYIKNSHTGRPWTVYAPDGGALEEFKFENDAILWMQDTHDFLTPMGYKRKYGMEKPSWPSSSNPEPEEDFPEKTDPDEEDIVIPDNERQAFYAGNLIAETPNVDWDELYRRIVAWMDKNRYWPDVWHQDDHGGWNLVSEDVMRYAKRRPGSARKAVVRSNTGEADQDYDHAFFDAIVHQLSVAGFKNARHRMFDKYQGVYLDVPMIDTFWVKDSYYTGQPERDPSVKWRDAELIEPEGDSVSPSRGDYFTKPGDFILKGYLLRLRSLSGEWTEVEDPTINDLPDISEVERTFGYKKGTRMEVVIFEGEDTGKTAEVVSTEDGAVDASGLVALCRKIRRSEKK